MTICSIRIHLIFSQVKFHISKYQPPNTAAKSAPAPESSADDYSDIDLTNMRKTIANRLCESKNNIPHYYLTRSIKTDNVNAVRKQLNAISDVKISVNDFVIKVWILFFKRVRAFEGIRRNIEETIVQTAHTICLLFIVEIGTSNIVQFVF